MQERHVTVAGASYDLPKPFHVLATQNPIEQEGTYPLPEAQLDRFLLKVDVDYPDQDTERRILVETTGLQDQTVRPVLDAERLLAMQALVRRMPVRKRSSKPFSEPRALGATGTDRSSAGEEARRLGSVAARWPGADAGGAFARAAARPPCAFAG
jgi:MoxR-like ATPase